MATTQTPSANMASPPTPTPTPPGSLEAHFPGLGEFLVDLDLDTSSSRALPTPARKASQAKLAADRRASELEDARAWKVFWTLVLLWVTILVVCAPFQFIWPLAAMELLGILIFGIRWAIKKVREWGAPANEANEADHGLTEVVVEP